MDGLEAVAHVRQRAGDDDAHRVVEVRDAHLVLDADGSDVAHVVGHVVGLLRSSRSGDQVRSMMGRAAGGTSTPSAGSRPRRTAARDVVGAPGVRRMPVELAPQLVGERRGSLANVSRMTHARWPSSVARRVAASARRNAAVAARSTSASVRSAHESAFWTSGSGVADEVAQQRQAVRRRPPARGRARRGPRAGSVAIVEPDEAALPARRRVDELLELRPAVGLGEDPAAGDVGEAVDRGPLGRATRPPRGPAARRAPARRRPPLQQVDADPAQLGELVAEEGGGDVEDRGRAGRAGVRAGGRARPPRAAAGGRRGRARCPGTTCCALVVLGVREPSRPVRRVATSAAGSWTCSPRAIGRGRPRRRCGRRRTRGRAAVTGLAREAVAVAVIGVPPR